MCPGMNTYIYATDIGNVPFFKLISDDISNGGSPGYIVRCLEIGKLISIIFLFTFFSLFYGV